MSRVGNKAVQIPNGIQFDVQGRQVVVAGPRGKLELAIPTELTVELNGQVLRVDVCSDGRQGRALHGLYRTLLTNMIVGVQNGFEKRLELSGVGYQCAVKGNQLELSVGFSRPVVFEIPPGITCVPTDNTHLIVSGIDKQAVGQFAAKIHEVRTPDPYKAKGVRYQGEVIRRKAGKAFGSSG
jgi:large subunit ribosomal protein L6